MSEVSENHSINLIMPFGLTQGEPSLEFTTSPDGHRHQLTVEEFDFPRSLFNVSVDLGVEEDHTNDSTSWATRITQLGFDIPAQDAAIVAAEESREELISDLIMPELQCVVERELVALTSNEVDIRASSKTIKKGAGVLAVSAAICIFGLVTSDSSTESGHDGGEWMAIAGGVVASISSLVTVGSYAVRDSSRRSAAQNKQSLGDANQLLSEIIENGITIIFDEDSDQ